ncbi:hypothetical protein NE237_032738 [Protea cynaroides]|uniref:Uncharacterized protein n=1 Tax=Protea cynaroides TaxID=273540 RepID=A0A9Q0L4I9_9MAGN|nr:hypothetical protein NE237_032738 [Protea cynaroides]
MNLGNLNKVWEIKALKKVGEDEARKILQKIASQVEPIMRKHKWRVKLLSEFCPNNRSLLGLNVGGGVQVKLRLRKPNRESEFYPYHQILDTMLHELCHNSHGPHNANFYKLWDEIRKECEELIAKGITGTGEGFDLQGRRLGGSCRQPPLSSLRQTALTAAEKRLRLGSLLPSGPKRLGGDSNIMVALSPIQAAAMAAERRMQDDLWCGCSGMLGEEESNSNVLQKLTCIVPSAKSSKNSNVSEPQDSVLKPRKKIRLSDDESFTHSSDLRPECSFVDLTVEASTSGTMLNHAETDDTEDRVSWYCGTCTLSNPPLAPICDACGSQKPKDVRVKFKTWSCRFCTLENSVKEERCSACEQWRYSNGPPVSTPASNVGIWD